MATAWLALLPAGVLVARFCKVTPRQNFPQELDNPLWWNLHRLLQYSGLAVALLGFALVYRALGHHLLWRLPHAALGLTVLGLGVAQFVSVLLRGTKGGPTDTHANPADPSTWRGDHYDMTWRRLVFEAFHKSAGYTSLALAVPAVWTGLDLAGLPGWTKAAPILAAATFVTAFVWLTAAGRRTPTWEAIWGPSRP